VAENQRVGWGGVADACIRQVDPLLSQGITALTHEPLDEQGSSLFRKGYRRCAAHCAPPQLLRLLLHVRHLKPETLLAATLGGCTMGHGSAQWVSVVTVGHGSAQRVTLGHSRKHKLGVRFSSHCDLTVCLMMAPLCAVIVGTAIYPA